MKKTISLTFFLCMSAGAWASNTGLEGVPLVGPILTLLYIASMAFYTISQVISHTWPLFLVGWLLYILFKQREKVSQTREPGQQDQTLVVKVPRPDDRKL